MKLTREQIGVAIIFVLVLAIRLSYTLPMDSFDYDAYFVLRQAEAISDTGIPLFHDPLSYSGRTFLFPPLFHYVIAAFSLFMGVETAAKLVTALCFASLVIIVFLIAREMTKNGPIALISAVFAGFIPLLYFDMGGVPPHALGIVLVFLMSYFFLRLEDERFASLGLLFAVLALLTSPDIFIFLAGLLFYFLILFLERQKPTKKEIEMTVFLFFLTIWFNALLYKKAFLVHGVGVLWSNLPTDLLTTYFHKVSFVEILYSVGVIPLLLGLYAVYHLVFDSKNRDAQLYAGFAFASFAALWLKMVPLSTGLLFLSVNVIILSAYTMRVAHLGAAKTKMASLAVLLATAVVVLFFLTSITPFFSYKGYEPQDPEDLAALDWLRANSEPGATVLGRVEEGFLINYEAQRRNAADSNFLFIRNADQVYKDIGSLFELRLKSEAVRLINAYGIEYIFLSKKTQGILNITGLFYAEGDCFSLVYEKGAKIYRTKGCTV